MRKLWTILIAFFISGAVLAGHEGKTFNLLASPDDKADVVVKMPIGAPIIPVIREKGWVKVADPKTGAVGWVQTDKIDRSPVVITQIIAGNSDYCKNNSCQFSFYSSNRPLSPRENTELWRKVQQHERYLMAEQLAMQRRMNAFMDDMNTLMARNMPSDLQDDEMISQELPKEKKKPFWKFWESK